MLLLGNYLNKKIMFLVLICMNNFEYINAMKQYCHVVMAGVVLTTIADVVDIVQRMQDMEEVPCKRSKHKIEKNNMSVVQKPGLPKQEQYKIIKAKL